MRTFLLSSNQKYGVGPTGLEPIMTEPKPVVLPLHHGPNFDLDAKLAIKCLTSKFSLQNFPAHVSIETFPLV